MSDGKEGRISHRGKISVSTRRKNGVKRGLKGGLAFHTSEIKLVRSIIKDKENVSITDYCLLLLRSFENTTSTNNLTTANVCPMN